MKKYIGQVLSRTGCTNRTELALVVAGHRPQTPAREGGGAQR
ncbi:hypothetical protein ACFPK1_12380 [Actinomycetospora rhizophila]|uniref:HTH luxR-type domain-containing protein n=1 Tax=Actinomycetospora rhizophila TaxID=1416876 RepID=A0ABV9ZBQ2_9PSEU